MNNKVNEQTIETVATEIKRGVPIKYAVVLGGISLTTHYKYYNLGKKIVESDEEYEVDNVYVRYFQEMEMAKAYAIAARVENIRQAGEMGTWSADAWYLERVDHENFGRKSVIDANVNADVKHENLEKLFSNVKLDEILKEE